MSGKPPVFSVGQVYCGWEIVSIHPPKPPKQHRRYRVRCVRCLREIERELISWSRPKRCPCRKVGDHVPLERVVYLDDHCRRYEDDPAAQAFVEERGGAVATLEDIGEVTGYTRENVRLLIEMALRSFRRACRRHGISESDVLEWLSRRDQQRAA